MHALRSSAELLGDGEALRARLAEHGYLYFPRLLDPEPLRSLRSEILQTVARFGWLAEGTDPQDARPSSPARWHGGPGWLDGYVAVQRLEAFHRQAHDPTVLALLRSLYDEDDLLVHGQRIARIIWPEDDLTTLPHQDYTHIQGTSDFVTTWVPLSDCPRDLGGLQILVGSHTRGVRPLEPAEGGRGSGSIRSIVDADDPAWATADWRRGDLALFHPFTVHGALPNRSDRLRISVDYRYQSAQDPVARSSLMPHNAPFLLPDWPELLEGTKWSRYDWVDRVRSIDAFELADFRRPTSIETWHEEIGEPPESRFLAGSASGSRRA